MNQIEHSAGPVIRAQLPLLRSIHPQDIRAILEYATRASAGSCQVFVVSQSDGRPLIPAGLASHPDGLVPLSEFHVPRDGRGWLDCVACHVDEDSIDFPEPTVHFCPWFVAGRLSSLTLRSDAIPFASHYVPFRFLGSALAYGYETGLPVGKRRSDPKLRNILEPFVVGSFSPDHFETVWEPV